MTLEQLYPIMSTSRIQIFREGQLFGFAESPMKSWQEAAVPDTQDLICLWISMDRLDGLP